MNPLTQSKNTTILIALMLICFALSSTAQAVCQEGCLTLDNTVLGNDALLFNTTGHDNTAIGWDALAVNTTGSNNTATGSQALFSNTIGFRNTATGFGALQLNTTGSSNTATGSEALRFNTTGSSNTATGFFALAFNTTGISNTAIGSNALLFNTTGNFNTAIGVAALFSEATGNNNTAIGYLALQFNSGDSNIAVGESAGFNLTTGSNNIDIGSKGLAGESNTIRVGTVGTQTNAYIAGIYQTPVAQGLVVKIDSTGHLGTVGSSIRFKDEIKPMDRASEAILSLKPVTFRYKKDLDPEGIPQFGLVAEEVEKVNPDLVARDADGKVYTVRYEAVNAMLLNEFLKEHRKVEELEANAARQQREIKALTASLKEQAAQIQKVCAQLEASKPAPQVVNNP